MYQVLVQTAIKFQRYDVASQLEPSVISLLVLLFSVEIVDLL